MKPEVGSEFAAHCEKCALCGNHSRVCWSFMESRFPFQPREELLPPRWGENGSVSRPVLINTWIHEYGSGSHRRLMCCRVQSFGLGLFTLEWTGCSTLLNNNKNTQLSLQTKKSMSHFTPPISFFYFISKKYTERYLSTMILKTNNLHIYSLWKLPTSWSSGLNVSTTAAAAAIIPLMNAATHSGPDGLCNWLCLQGCTFILCQSGTAL